MQAAAGKRTNPPRQVLFEGETRSRPASIGRRITNTVPTNTHSDHYWSIPCYGTLSVTHALLLPSLRVNAGLDLKLSDCNSFVTFQLSATMDSHISQLLEGEYDKAQNEKLQ